MFVNIVVCCVVACPSNGSLASNEPSVAVASDEPAVAVPCAFILSRDCDRRTSKSIEFFHRKKLTFVVVRRSEMALKLTRLRATATGFAGDKSKLTKNTTGF